MNDEGSNYRSNWLWRGGISSNSASTSLCVHSLCSRIKLARRTLAMSFPHMQDLVDNRLEPADLDKLAAEVDVVFTATPSGVAMNLAPQLIEKGVKVIDLSGD